MNYLIHVSKPIRISNVYIQIPRNKNHTCLQNIKNSIIKLMETHFTLGSHKHISRKENTERPIRNYKPKGLFVAFFRGLMKQKKKKKWGKRELVEVSVIEGGKRN